MEIYIVRHGQTIWNKERRLQGRTNIPLSEEGREVAIKTGIALRKVHFDKVYSSPLDRAYETACLICGERDIEIQKDDRLYELNFGNMEGRVMDELKASEDTKFRYFFDNPEQYEPDDRGETLEELCKRGAEFMRTEIEPYENRWQRVMIVGHGAMNKALMTHIKQIDISDFWSGGLQKNCNVMIIQLEHGKYHIIDEEKIFYNK